MNNDAKKKKSTDNHSPVSDAASESTDNIQAEDPSTTPGTSSTVTPDGKNAKNMSSPVAPVSAEANLLAEENAQAISLGKKLHSDPIVAEASTKPLKLVDSIIQAYVRDTPPTNFTSRAPFTVEYSTVDSAFSVNPTSTPFTVKSAIPSFFEFISVQNAEQDPNVKNKRLHAYNEIPQIVQSIELFNTETMTVRSVLRKSINDVAIPDPNVPQGTVLEIKQVDSWKNNLLPRASLLEQRLRTLICLFNATDNVLYSIPSKITATETIGSTPLHNFLSHQSYWEGDYPNILLSALGSSEAWYVQELNDLFQQINVSLGESRTRSVYGKKVSACISAFTDQFSTSLAKLNFQRLQQQQTTPNQYVQRIRANMFPQDDARLVSSSYTDYLSLLYQPSAIEYDMMMNLIISSRSIRDSLFQKIKPLYASTNLFRTYNLDEVWSMDALPTDTVSRIMYENWRRWMAVGSDATIYDLLAFETFSDWYNFKIHFPALPNDDAAVIEIMAILFTAVLFPRTTNRAIEQIGWRLIKLLDNYVPRAYAEWVRTYGEVRLGDQQGPTTGLALTRDQSALGWTYSIFSPVPYRRPVSQQFFDIIRRIREIMTPIPAPLHLARKRIASYPYYSTNYEAQLSYPPLEPQDIQGIPITDWSRKLIQVVDLAATLLTFRSARAQGGTTLSKTSEGWVKTFFSNIKNIVKSGSLPFQETASQLQNAMCNSFAFVFDQYNPNNMFTLPPPVVLAPTRDAAGQMGVPIQKTEVGAFDIYTAFRLLMTVEGQRSRNIQLLGKGNPTTPASTVAPKMQTQMLEGHMFDDIAQGLITTSRKFGVAQQLIRWLTLPQDPNNPIRHIAERFAVIMRMSNWAPLTKLILQSFGFDFQDLYVDACAPTTGAFDARQLSRALTLINPQTNLPIQENIPGTIWAREMDFVDQSIYQAFQIISKLVVEPDSPILNLTQGGYVGRFMVDELTSQQVDVEQGWTLVEYDDVQFMTVNSKGGQAQSLQINAPNALQREYALPRDRLMPKIMLHLRSVTQIIPSYRKNLATAIQLGNLALKVDNLLFSTQVQDLKYRNIDYSAEMSIDQLLDVLNTPDGSYIHASLPTTLYASNFTTNAEVIPQYIQWLCTYDQMDRTLHAAVLASGTARTPQTVLPLPYELDFGRDSGSVTRQFPDGTSKVDRPIINYNNDYMAIGKELTTVPVKIEYVPSVPIGYEEL